MSPADLAARYVQICAVVADVFDTSVGRAWIRRCARASGRRGMIEASDLTHDVALLFVRENDPHAAHVPRLAFDPGLERFEDHVLRLVAEVLAGEAHLDGLVTDGDPGSAPCGNCLPEAA